MESFGARLRELRRVKDITQKALAEALGVSPQAVSKWESGRSFPEAPLLVPMAQLFGISTDELLGHRSQDQKWDEEWRRAILAEDPGQAVRTALEALEYYPEQLHFLWQLAQAEEMAAAFREGEEKQRFLQNADMHYRAILRQFPDFGEAILHRARVLVRLGRHSEAEALVRRLPDPDEALLLVLQEPEAWKKQRRLVTAKAAHKFWDYLHNLDPELAERFLLDYPWDERDRIDRLSSLCVLRAEKLCRAGEPEAAMDTLDRLRELSRRMREARRHPETSEALFACLQNDSTGFPDGWIHAFSVLHSPWFRALEDREEYRALVRLAERRGMEEEEEE